MTSRFVAGAIAAVTLATLAAAPVSAAPGGRVELRDEAIRTVDTRTGQGATQGTSTRVEVGSGALQVWVLAPEVAGTAVIHPCAEPAPTDRSNFRLDPAQPLQYARIFTPDLSCVSSTTPIHVIVDDGGTVSESPTADGDQYVPLASSTVLSTADIPANAVLEIPRPPRVTIDASAAVIGLRVLRNDDLGFLSAYGCDGPRPLSADVSYSRGVVANIAAVPLGPGENICVYSSSEVTVRTSLVGELRAEGPDPEALPPTWNYVPAPVTAPSLRSINPQRVVDTRDAAVLAADDTLEVVFGELVGPLTSAVSMNVTAANAAGNGFLTVWPCNGDRPEASNLNFTSAGAVPNLVVTKLSTDGTACISASTDVNVIVDVNGTYEADGGLTAVPVEPVRILDTRNAIGTPTDDRVAADSEIVLQVTGGDVPADAGAATLNVTAAGSDLNGFVTVYPCGSPRPFASNLNFRAGEATPNLVTTALSPEGTVCLYAEQTVHLIADLASWYGVEQPAGLVELAPTRVLDTRDGTGVTSPGTTRPNAVIELDFALTPTVAADADAVVMNVTSVQPDGIGFVTVWPCDQVQPTVSNLNVRSGRTVANLATVKLSAEGTVCMTSTSTMHLVADVAGYLTDVPVDGDALVLGS